MIRHKAALKFDFQSEPPAGPEGAFLSFHKGTACNPASWPTLKMSAAPAYDRK